MWAAGAHRTYGLNDRTTPVTKQRKSPMKELDPEIRELARDLGELRLLWLDMSHARALFERLAEMPDGFGDFRLASALWISGLIMYRRCFTSGKGTAVGQSRALTPHG